MTNDIESFDVRACRHGHVHVSANDGDGEEFALAMMSPQHAFDLANALIDAAEKAADMLANAGVNEGEDFATEGTA
jgi:hypothetical protein